MRIVKPGHLLIGYLAATCAVSYAADVFAPPGAKATLSVDYIYESAGKKSSEGMYDPYEWRVKRHVSLTAELAAQANTAMPTVQAIDTAQMAKLEGTGRKAQAAATSAATQMAPMMADVQQVMAKCGEDEACITREIEKMGNAMAGTPKVDAARKAGKSAQQIGGPGEPRYQAWRARTQTGTYLIDERVQVSVTDPICAGKPRHRCSREEVRKGSGGIPVPQESKRNKDAAAGISAAELDAVANTLTMLLPIPLAMLPYTETITSDEPSGTHETPIPKGPQQKAHQLRLGGMPDKPLTVALKGNWRNQSGEQIVKLNGNFGDGGTLVVRWRFAVQ